MMEGIAHIVAYYLLCLEFIRPHIHWLLLPEDDLCLRLLGKDLHALDNASYKFRQIKPLEHDVFIAKLQLIQRQQILNHLVHLRRFIHDDVTVEFPAFRVFIDSFPQPFRISLDQGDRRL